MMHSKGYLLLTILLGIIIFSTFVNAEAKRDDSALDRKTSSSAQDNEDEGEQADTEEETTDNSARYGKPYKGYRKRPMHLTLPWPATYEQFINAITMAQMQKQNANAQQTLSGAYTNNPMVNVAPTCNTLIDTQYPIFSDMCGAVPQARYILPNTFGHNDRWVLSHILTSLMSASTDQACTRSLRVLLCPMLFQPCRLRHEPPLILPCQAFCRAVKAQCGSSALDVIPCDILPYSSDLCPVNQPFNPFSPSATTPTFVQPSLPNPAPSTESQTSRSYAPQALQQNVQSVENQPQSVKVSAGTYLKHSAPPTGNVNAMQADLPPRVNLDEYRQASKFVQSVAGIAKPRAGVEAQQTNEARLVAGSAGTAA